MTGGIVRRLHTRRNRNHRGEPKPKSRRGIEPDRAERGTRMEAEKRRTKSLPTAYWLNGQLVQELHDAAACLSRQPQFVWCPSFAPGRCAPASDDVCLSTPARRSTGLMIVLNLVDSVAWPGHPEMRRVRVWLTHRGPPCRGVCARL